MQPRQLDRTSFSLDESSVSVHVACPLDSAFLEELVPLEADCGDFVETTNAGEGERGVDRGTDFNGTKTRPPILPEDSERKRYLIIDALCVVLVFLIYAANVADVTHSSQDNCGKSFFQLMECAFPVGRLR